MGRYLVEHRVEYRGACGTCDLYDRRLKIVCDWKFKTLAKIKRLRRNEGLFADYVTQIQLYGAGLKAQGEDPHEVALVFLPVDGELEDLYVWRTPFDQSVADVAIDRLAAVNDKNPSEVTASPSNLCPWCPWFRANTVDLDKSCPGKETK